MKPPKYSRGQFVEVYREEVPRHGLIEDVDLDERFGWVYTVRFLDGTTASPFMAETIGPANVLDAITEEFFRD